MRTGNPWKLLVIYPISPHILAQLTNYCYYKKMLSIQHFSLKQIFLALLYLSLRFLNEIFMILLTNVGIEEYIMLTS